MKPKFLLIIGILFIARIGFSQDQPSSIYSNRFFSMFSLSYQKSMRGYTETNDYNSRFFPGSGNLKGRFGLSLSGSQHYFLIPEVLAFGLGIGFYKSYKPNFAYLPLLYDLRYYIFQESKAFYIGLQLGQAFINGKHLLRGYHLELKIGFLFQLLDEHEFGVELGLRGTNLSLSDESYFTSSRIVNTSGIVLGVSYYFLK